MILFSLLLGLCYVTSMFKKLELRLLVIIVLFKNEFGHIQIIVPKIAKPMPKRACINPLYGSTLCIPEWVVCLHTLM